MIASRNQIKRRQRAIFWVMASLCSFAMGPVMGQPRLLVNPPQVVAADGLTMDRTMTTNAVTLQPGYRFDILTIVPEAGEYCITESAKEADATVSNADGPANLLGFVTVGGTAKVAVKDMTKALVETLVRSAMANMPPTVRDQIVRDLRVTDPTTKQPVPHLTRFVPHPTIMDAELKGVPEQNLVFFIGVPPNNAPTQFMAGNSFSVAEQSPGYLIPKGAAQYDPNRIDRSLTLGTAKQWELRGYEAIVSAILSISMSIRSGSSRLSILMEST